MLTVGLLGFSTREIVSIDRTANAYLNALNDMDDVQTVILNSPDDANQLSCDTIIDFDHSCVRTHIRPPCRVIFCMHGTVARCFDLYEGNTGIFAEHDSLVVNCSSDLAILDQCFEGLRAQRQCLHLPISSPQFRRLSKDSCRAALGLDSDIFFIGFVGRIFPPRNVHRVIDLACELAGSNRTRKIGVLLVGNECSYQYFDWYNASAYPAQVRAKISAARNINCVTLANVTDSDLALCYNAMDMLYQPSNVPDENFGYSPLEALACGTPVIACRWGGFKDTLENGPACQTIPTWITRAGIRAEYGTAVGRGAAILDRAFDVEEACTNEAKRVTDRFSRSQFSRDLHQILLHGGATAPPPHPPDQALSKSGLQLARSPSIIRSAGFEGFNKIVPAMNRYASGLPPTLTNDTFLELTSEIAWEGESCLRLRDPAWPAFFTMQEPARQIVKAIGGGTTPRLLATKLHEPLHLTLHRCSDLVTEGLFVTRR